MSPYRKVIERPDPRQADAWCGEGVTHDHGADIDHFRAWWSP